MSDYIFGVVNRGPAPARSRARKMDQIARKNGCTFIEANVQRGSSPHINGGDYQSWFAGPNQGEPFNTQLSNAVYAEIDRIRGQKMHRVITVQNVYTRKVSNLCREHYEQGVAGDVQVQHGEHESYHGCDECEATTLRADHTPYGWRVIDGNGGVWWPDRGAAAEIGDSGSPAELAIEICTTQPQRGGWHF